MLVIGSYHKPELKQKWNTPMGVIHLKMFLVQKLGMIYDKTTIK